MFDKFSKKDCKKASTFFLSLYENKFKFKEMKKNLLLTMALGALSLSYGQVNIDWSVDEISAPTELQTAADGSTELTTNFVLKNNGTDSALIGDTVLYQMIIKTPTGQTLVAIPNGSVLFFVLNKDMGVGDTLQRTFSARLTSGATRSFDIKYSVFSSIVNRARGITDGTTANNTKEIDIVWKMVGGFGVSVQDIDAGSINVYPTVADKFVTVDVLVKHVNTKPVVSLFDMQGKEISTSTMVGSIEKIDVSSLASGVYILKIVNGSEVYSTKIMKN